ncbi:LysE family transporter [Candidatus Oleimmundimicrobium sp.]|uniref:LysE family transporter n=1 Tax=Candidatus Oleimmundimicrobium sp. TaxID=3060597 RepID=UPI002721D005|nr:LysE family transporter [Candidatus Oleimmundimicrobium sp.]MDO8885688.1 LysE family transporter [Candidatus Oleimmundimicrobium sp.]
MELIGIFITSLIVGFSGAIMPGPLLAVTINEVHQRGFWSGPLIVLGHAILELILVVALALGFQKILLTQQLLASSVFFGAFSCCGWV